MLKKLIIIFSITQNFLAYSRNFDLKMCIDDNEQIPLVILNNGKIQGVEIDIVNQAIKNLRSKLNAELKLEVMPWSRCLQMAKKGEFDAVLNASYNEERAAFLDYPPDSGPKEPNSCASEFKIDCSGYIVITLKTNDFEYDGKPSQLPTPVRVSRGYSVVPELEKIFQENLEIGKSDFVNVNKLIRDKQGSMVAYLSFRNKILKSKDISNKVKIHKKNYTMKSYYVPFSKNSKFSNEEKILIWTEIRNIVNNKKLMNSFYLKYTKME